MIHWYNLSINLLLPQKWSCDVTD